MDLHWFQNADPDLAYNGNADPDPNPNPRSQTNADSDPGQTYKSQKVELLQEKYNKNKQEVKKNITANKGTTAFMNSRKPGKFRVERKFNKNHLSKLKDQRCVSGMIHSI